MMRPAKQKSWFMLLATALLLASLLCYAMQGRNGGGESRASAATQALDCVLAPLFADRKAFESLSADQGVVNPDHVVLLTAPDRGSAWPQDFVPSILRSWGVAIRHGNEDADWSQEPRQLAIRLDKLEIQDGKDVDSAPMELQVVVTVRSIGGGLGVQGHGTTQVYTVTKTASGWKAHFDLSMEF